VFSVYLFIYASYSKKDENIYGVKKTCYGVKYSCIEMSATCWVSPDYSIMSYYLVCFHRVILYFSSWKGHL